MRKSNSFIGMGLLLAAIISVYAQTPPIITKQPVNQSVSLGARVILGVTATGTEPLSYLWFFNGAPISEAVQRLLILTNAQVSNAGGYSVIITNISGAITSEVAILKVDPTFLKINTGAIVTDTEPSEGVAWFDLDNDNLLDLFVANIQGVMNSVYRNQGDGTFVKIKNAITTMNNSWNGAPGDLNNDGWTDLYVVTPTGAGNHLFRNDRSLDFTSLTDQQCGPPVRDRYESADAAWADYDGDGWLDLFVVNGINASQDDCLYRNIGNGSFIKMTASQVGPLVDDNAKSGSCSWADYNNDGYPDLWVLNLARTNLLYLNNRDGTFSRVIQGSVVEPKIGDATQGGDGGGAWGDYDNDGYQDLFVAGGESFTNSLHRNMGGETFTNVAESAGLAQKTGAALGAWGDYDNDGFLDLFAPSYSGPTNALYHNNGDGTFTAIDVGSPTYEGSSRIGTAWADYDNDGFLDLIISCGNGQNMHNLLYRNQGNGNHWLKVRLIGTTSNRAGIGAKIRVKASIRGKTIWQLRELSGNSGWSGGQGLVTHFGLGDATNIDVVRIEWPSGNVQEMNAVTSDQILTITESTGIKPANPSSSLGGEVTLTSQMTGAYQWLFNEA
ncbi:MAG TPA: FG-GAP-like repeat-containing protein, partial [Candidatus Paceibacterota bacterium]|nr:FG-GAP-like repeat-containing protein [Candidatus Paceibacterota bacterium]